MRAQGGDAVGGGAAGGVGAAAEDGGDLGVGQAGQVVVGDRLPLLGGQRGERGPQVVRPCSGRRRRRAGLGHLVDRDRAARPAPG